MKDIRSNRFFKQQKLWKYALMTQLKVLWLKKLNKQRKLCLSTLMNCFLQRRQLKITEVKISD